MIDTAVILAAGIGSRMNDVYGELPKPLIPVAGVPIIIRVIHSAAEAGIRRFVVVTGHRADEVENVVTNHLNAEIDVTFVYNAEYATRAVGASVLAARPLVADRFALLMADHIFAPEILRDLIAAPLHEGECSIAVDRQLHRVLDLADAKKIVERDGFLVAIGRNLTEFTAVDTGLFACTPALFDALDTACEARACGSRACEARDGTVSDALRILASQGRMRTFAIGEGYWFDVDTPVMVKEAERLLAMHV